MASEVPEYLTPALASVALLVGVLSRAPQVSGLILLLSPSRFPFLWD